MQFALSNGLRVFLLEDHELPVVQGSLLMRGGQRASPPDKASPRPSTASPWLGLWGSNSCAGLANSEQGLISHLYGHSRVAAQCWHRLWQQHLLPIQIIA